jgi:putative transposase
MVRRRRPSEDEGTGTYLANGARAKGGLNRSIHDAGWGQLLSFLAYEEETGRELIAVDPATRRSAARPVGTWKRPTGCQAEFRCLACGHQAQADVNAAKNILRTGRARRELAPVKV